MAGFLAYAYFYKAFHFSSTLTLSLRIVAESYTNFKILNYVFNTLDFNFSKRYHKYLGLFLLK